VLTRSRLPLQPEDRARVFFVKPCPDLWMAHNPEAGSRYACVLKIAEYIILLSISTSEVEPVEDFADTLVSPVLVIFFCLFLQFPPDFFGFENFEASSFPIY